MSCAEAGQGAAPKSVDITEDWSAIRIPAAMDFADNYVTGLGGLPLEPLCCRKE